MSQLALMLGGNVVKLFPLEKPMITIGRHQGNDIQIDSDYVSSRHAKILVEPTKTLEGHEDIVLEDLGSANGVLVNGKRVERCQLKPNDVITIVGSHFKLLDDRQSSSQMMAHIMRD